MLAEICGFGEACKNHDFHTNFPLKPNKKLIGFFSPSSLNTVFKNCMNV